MNIEKTTSNEAGLFLKMINGHYPREEYSDEIDANEAVLTEPLFDTGDMALLADCREGV